MIRATRDTANYRELRLRGYHPLWPSFPAVFYSSIVAFRGPTTPTGKPAGLGSSAFARRYLRNLFEFSSSGYLDVSVHQVRYLRL